MDKEIKCIGFPEQVVLAVKSCFYETDMKQLIIEKDNDRIVYHHRLCSKTVERAESFKISQDCHHWFTTLHSHEDCAAEADSQEGDCKERPGEGEGGPEEGEGGGNAHFKTKRKDPSTVKQEFQTIGVSESKSRARETVPSEAADKSMKRTRKRGDTKPIICDREGCETIFDKKQQLKEHVKTVHQPQKLRLKPVIELPEDERQCPICNKEFTKKVFLTRHIRRHATSAQACHICGQMVKELQVHIKQRHTEKDKLRYFCEFCGKGFKGYSSHAFHIAGHTGERKYTCKQCGRNYRTSSEQHKCERAHQGLFKYNCDKCTYRTHQKNKYVRHLRIHTKSAPYRCPICEHRAARKDYLQKHIMKTHSDLTLDQVETSYPNLYQIEEKISLGTGPAVEVVLEEELVHEQELIHEQEAGGDEVVVEDGLVHQIQQPNQMFLVSSVAPATKFTNRIPDIQDAAEREQKWIILSPEPTVGGPS